MNRMTKKWFEGAQEGDERIRAGRERAGNASFCVVMFLLWLAMAAGLLADRLDLVLVPFAVFMTGCVLYLFFIVRNGSFESEKTKARGKRRTVLGYAAGGIAYAAIQFAFRLRAAQELTRGATIDAAIHACVGAALWVALFAALVAFLRKRSDRRNAEKME